jgi:universal stress protein F
VNTLLVALDGSPRARGVLDAAVALARRMDSRLVLVRATSISGELPIEAYASDPDAISRSLEARTTADLRAMAEDAPPGVVAGVRAAPGVAWRVIDGVAREEDAAMIILGAHGYGTLERVLGTVAAKVVDHADRPVLVVRDPARFSR